MRQDWEYRQLDDVCSIDYGTRVVQKNEKGSTYHVYGGGGATFKVDRYNREDCFIVSRFAMSPKCTRFVSGKFFLNDSGLSVSTKDKRSLRQSFVDKALLANNDTIYAMGKGVAQKNLDMPSFRRLQIPIPPIAEQEKIVAELDCLSSIIEKKKQQLEELDKLVQSIFYDMFGDPITNEKGWEVKKMGSFSSCLAGATPSTTHEEYWENGTIPWLSSGEVGKGRIYDTEKRITQVGYESCSTRLVPAHTLVIAMAGQGKTRGTAGVAEIPLCTNQSICSIIPNEEVALVDFLYYQMQQMYKDLRSISNGDGGRGGLNLKLIGNYPVIVPPLDLQNEFAQKIEAIEKQKELVKQSIVETETLFNSRMDYWFN